MADWVSGPNGLEFEDVGGGHEYNFCSTETDEFFSP